LVLFLVLGERSPKIDEQPSTPSIGSGAAATDVYRTTAEELFRNYEANEVATDEKIKGRIVEISGTVGSIGKDFTDSVVIGLATSNRYRTAHMFMKTTQRRQAAELSQGMEVTIRCKTMHRILLSPSGGDCEFWSESPLLISPPMPAPSGELATPTPPQTMALPAATNTDGNQTGAVSDREAEEFINFYIYSSNAATSVADVMRFYGPNVDYYNRGIVSKDMVMVDKARYFVRWPNRTYVVNGDMKLSTAANGVDKNVSYIIKYEVASGEKVANGEADVALTLSRIDGQLLIIRETEEKRSAGGAH
jgi:hypothetical protein